jgi:hypothetical protein
MKASRFFFGRDSFSRYIEVAEAVDGRWFSRSYTGGNGWTRWADWEPSWTGTTLYWGFNILSESAEVPRVRLPNPEVLV